MSERGLQRRREELAVVAEVASAMLSPVSLEQVLNVAIQTVGRALGARCGSITLLSPDKSILEFAAVYNLTPDYVQRIQLTAPIRADTSTPSGRAVVTRQPYAVTDVLTDPLFAPWKRVAEQEGYRSIILVPLLAGGEAAGTLNIYLPEPHTFPPSEIRLLTVVAQQIGLALERARLYEELRREHAAAQAANERKSQFLAAMSHELRTPLTAVLGFTDILLSQRGGPLTPEQQWQLRVVSASTQHVLLLINDALDLAKIEAGKMECQRETVDAGALAAEVVEMLLPLAEAKNLTLVRRNASPPLALYADPRKCKQILVNLVSNAIKFTSEGGVEIAARRDPADPRYGCFAVSDTGAGIREQDRVRLFREFEQLDASPSGGSGLGLSLSRKLARLMGGDIEAISEYGKGSTFTLKLEAVP